MEEPPQKDLDQSFITTIEQPEAKSKNELMEIEKPLNFEQFFGDNKQAKLD